MTTADQSAAAEVTGMARPSGRPRDPAGALDRAVADLQRRRALRDAAAALQRATDADADEHGAPAS